MSTTLLWFRQDMRLADNPALHWATERGVVLPVYILDETDPWGPGSASRWALHHSLVGLTAELKQRGLPLILRRGDPARLIPQLAAAAQADAVCWNRCYEPHAIARDTALKLALRDRAMTVTTHNSALLFEPWTIRTKIDTPFRVFTPFYRACLLAQHDLAPRPMPETYAAPPQLPASDRLEDWSLLPTTPNWAGGLQESWVMSSQSAITTLDAFIAQSMADYKTARDRPDLPGTSRLSPYLHFGQISPRQIWQQVSQAMDVPHPGLLRGGESFLREIIWREFCYHLLFHQPQMPDTPLQAAFTAFPWREDHEGLRTWQRGQTGFPIVDAGMRQLWQTGWLHNRVRMIVASFLVKDLLLPWQAGAAWFWDTLVDADLANNAAGWQWVAGCGADAAPYYRIFNPLLQSQKFDPDGAYIRRYVPELAKLPSAFIHAPASAPPEVLAAAGVRLGETYPHPMLDHRAAKDRALAALQTTKTLR